MLLIWVAENWILTAQEQLVEFARPRPVLPGVRLRGAPDEQVQLPMACFNCPMYHQHRNRKQCYIVNGWKAFPV